MADVRDLLSVVASLAVGFGVIVALIQLRALRRQRQEETVIQLMSHFGDEQFLDAFWRVQAWDFSDVEDFEARGSQADRVAWYEVGAFFELMGLLYKRGLASLDLLDDLLSHAVLLYWNSTAIVTTGYRAKHHVPQVNEWVEYLARAMDRRLTKLGERHPAFKENAEPLTAPATMESAQSDNL